MTSSSKAPNPDGRVTRITLLAYAAPPGAAATRFGGDAAADPAALRRLAARVDRHPTLARVTRSPARAAAETAAVLGLGATEDAALRDRNHGTWSGQSLETVAAHEPEAFAAWLGDPEAAPRGGESVSAMMARLGPWLDRQAAEGGPVLAIVHPAVIRACVVLALGAQPAVWFRLDVAHGTRSLLTRAGSAWRVGLVNEPL